MKVVRQVKRCLLAGCLLIASQHAAADITIQQAVADIVAYLTASEQTKVQADANLIFMESPGTDTAAKLAGSTAAGFGSILKSTLQDKELNDIHWALYGLPRPEESDKPVISNAHKYFLEKHAKYFCGINAGEGRIYAGCPKNVSSSNQFADIKASSLLGEDILTEAQKVLADDFIRTATTPFPSELLKRYLAPTELANPQSARIVATIMTSQGVIDIARNSFNEMYAARYPFLLGTQPVSKLSLMRNEVERRFQNTSWYDAVAISSNEALLRELLQMKAFELWMQFERSKRDERIEALLAALLSNSVNLGLSTFEAFQQVQ